MSDQKTVGTAVVLRTPIIGSSVVVYSAWMPSPGWTGEYSTIRHIDGQKYGRVGTERLPEQMERMPRGEQRRLDVRSWQMANYDAAYNMICEAYPELWDAPETTRSMGEISMLEIAANVGVN